MSVTLVDLTALSPPFGSEAPSDIGTPVGDAMSLLDLLALAPPFDFEPLADDFLTALRRRLKSVPGLSQLAEVYLTAAPPDAPMPFLVVNRLWQMPFLNLTDGYYKEVACQFTVIGDDAEQVDDMGNSAYDALFMSAMSPPILFMGGYEISRAIDRSRGPDADTGGMIDGSPTWRFSFDVVFLLGKG